MCSKVLCGSFLCTIYKFSFVYIHIYIYIYIKAHRREMERGEDRQKFRRRARKRGIETNGPKGGTLEVGGGGGCREKWM